MSVNGKCFEIGGSPTECGWKAVVIELLSMGWSFSIDFDDENKQVRIEIASNKKLMTFEI